MRVLRVQYAKGRKQREEKMVLLFDLFLLPLDIQTFLPSFVKNQTHPVHTYRVCTKMRCEEEGGEKKGPSPLFLSAGMLEGKENSPN